MTKNAIKRLKNLLGFLTIIPVGISTEAIEETAKDMYLFPIVGAFIGFLAGVFALLTTQVLPQTLAGFMVCGFLLLITGLQHADGLLDFGDGLMAHGSPEEKITVMRDPHVGVGGFALGVIVIFSTALCISYLDQDMIFQSLVVSEVYAKFSMVALARLGKSASKGLNTYFINVMRGERGSSLFVAALLISLAISFPLLWVRCLISLASTIAATLLVLILANRHFKGVTGDIMGATNEIARLASLLSMIVPDFA